MGSSASKVSRTAGQNVKRQYPPRVLQPSKIQHGQNPVGPKVHPTPAASSEKTAEISSDAFDPQLAASLRSIGPVTPNPTQSNSSTFAPATTPQTSGPVFPSPAANPALQVLQAREGLSQRAEQELDALGRKGAPRREFLDIMQVRQILMMRDQRKLEPDEIEGRLGLKPGVVARLGKRGVLTEVGDRYGTQSGGALG